MELFNRFKKKKTKTKTDLEERLQQLQKLDDEIEQCEAVIQWGRWGLDTGVSVSLECYNYFASGLGHPANKRRVKMPWNVERWLKSEVIAKAQSMLDDLQEERKNLLLVEVFKE